MRDKVFFIGILLALLILAGVVATFAYLTQVYINYKIYQLESCVRGGRYLTYLEGESISGLRTVWWDGRWNFEREECEKEDAVYQSIRETRRNSE